MTAAVPSTPEAAPHIPVLIRPILEAASPVQGTWLDGTFGAGGYTRAFLDAGAACVIAVDRDPLAFEMAADWAGAYGDRLVMQHGVFSRMDDMPAISTVWFWTLGSVPCSLTSQNAGSRSCATGRWTCACPRMGHPPLIW